jgi:hypothetical protein
LALIALSVVAASCLLALSAVPAGAIVKTIVTKAGPDTVGVTPMSIERGGATRSMQKTFANPSGDPVMHSSNIYAIYWDPRDEYDADWQQMIDNYLANLGAASGSLSTHFAVDSQYTDRTNGHASYATALRAAYTDTDPYPTAGCVDPNEATPKDHYFFGYTTCVNDQQIREELQRFVSTAEPGAPTGLPKGMNSLFIVLTPPGVAVCIDGGGAEGHCSDNPPKGGEPSTTGICGYHGAITSAPTTGDPNTLIYAVAPWIAGGLDAYKLGQFSSYTPEKLELWGTLGSQCQDGNWNPAEPIFDSVREGTKFEEGELKIEGGPVTEQEPSQLPLSLEFDGLYDHGLADLIINEVSTQQQNALTNPLLNAWQDENHNEVMDECRNFFLPTIGGAEQPNKNTRAGSLYNQALMTGKYYLNNTFNLAGLELPYPAIPCGVGGMALAPAFTSPSTANSGEIVGFNGMESNITLDWGTKYNGAGVPHVNYPLYTWNFGDGTPEVSGLAPGASSPGPPPCSAPWESPCAASVFHSYQYGGIYKVLLTVTDTGGNTASFSSPVTVIGPPPPSTETGTGTGPGTGTNGTNNGTSGAGNGPGGALIPGPFARAAGISRSLAKVVRGGLLVSYSVNEQVTGRFEVLLARTAAHRLKINAPLALGLPTTTPPMVVIGHAILTTTKGGNAITRIRFGKSVAARLRHAHRPLTLTLRLVVRNANSQTPVSTTVLSAITLH